MLATIDGCIPNEPEDTIANARSGHACTLLTTVACLMGQLAAGWTAAAPVGFIESSIALSAPPAGLAFDTDGVLYALEAAPFGTNVAALQAIRPDGSLGDRFSVLGSDPDNFFVGSMAYDPIEDRLLISDNTAEGRLYSVSKSGDQETLATGIAGIAGIAVRHTGEIFVTTAPFGSSGQVLQVDRSDGSTSPVLDNLGYGAGLAVGADGGLIIQDADDATFRGRLQHLPITEGTAGLQFGPPMPLLSDMQSSAGVVVDSEGDLFTTGIGGLYRIAGAPLEEIPFHDNGNPAQFATAIAFHAGPSSFEAFAGPGGGRLAYMADFGFAHQDTFVTLLTPAPAGDYNADGSVDEADYMAWQRAFNSTSDLNADGNGNGTVDAADYVIWRKNTAAQIASSIAGSPTSVPEPAALVPLLLATAVMGRRLPRQRPQKRSAEWDPS